MASKNKFLGPPNVQVEGLPVEGRSGGGLFSKDGMVVGVCNAADPADQQGLYAALGSIYSELDKNKLGFVYQAPGENRATDAPSRALVAVATAWGNLPASA